MQNPDTVVRIDAHASRLADADYNLRLTGWRARHNRSAMQAMVRPRITRHIEAIGHGEQEAIDDGVADGDDSPQYRRVDITINGTLALRLRSARSAPDANR